MTQFPISGIELHRWLPPLSAFVAAGLSSMAGVSGARLQRPVPARYIKVILAVLIMAVALRYLTTVFT